MKKTASHNVDASLVNSLYRSCGIIMLLLLALIGSASAQDYSMRTSASSASGASAGSYGLSDFDSVNLFNGSLSFRLPLLKIAGRGGAQVPFMLSIENHWRSIYVGENPDGTPNQGIVNYPWYRSELVLTDYRPGYMLGHHSAYADMNAYPPYPCGDSGPGRALATNTRFTFITPDGTQYKFKSKINNGMWADRTGVCSEEGYFRGREFITTDGTSAIFTANQDVYDTVYHGEDNFPASGVMMLRDGTRYTIDNKGLVVSIRDRNGNQINFTHTTYTIGGQIEHRLTGITDSLNRSITIAYDQQDGGVYGLCDRITFKGLGGATRIIRVSFKNLGTVLRADQPSIVSAYPKIAAVWLPDGKSYKFRYNVHGELARVELPMGGAFEYDFAAGINDPNNSFGTIGDPIYQGVYRRVVEKRIYDETGIRSITTFSRPETSAGNPPVPSTFPPPPGVDPATYTDFTNNLGYVDVSHRDPAKPVTTNLLSRERHYFYGSAATSVISSGDDPWKWGKEWQTEFYGTTNGSTVTLLRRLTHTWNQPPVIGYPYSQDFAPENNSHITETLTTLTDASPDLVSRQTFLYDVLDTNANNDFNNLLEIKEYGYGEGVPGALLRRTLIEYLTANNGDNYATDKNIHILNLPRHERVYKGSSTLQAETEYEYDRYTADADGKHATLKPCLGITGHVTSFNQNHTARGNLTATTRWILSPRRPITSYQQYDIAGNVVVTVDPVGNRTEFSYADKFGSPTGDALADSASMPEVASGTATYAFMTALTNAMNQTAYTKYDLYTGQPVDVEDVNGTVASFYYSRTHDPLAPASNTDELDRLAQVILRDSKASLPSKQATYTYLDSLRIIKTTSDLEAYKDNKVKTEIKSDGLGRTAETRNYETSSAYIKVEQKYDAMGRVSEITNPHRPAETKYSTVTTYDSLGRVIEVQAPGVGGAKVKTQYLGNVVTVTDQLQHSWQRKMDALGRLTTVIEDFGDAPGKLNYLTEYTYDALDNLTSVKQGTLATGSQTRNFVYDSLRRLISATNPETGLIKYEYYDNGTLKLKTDPREISPSSTVPVKTTYLYDKLNRITSKTYNDNITPKVNYYYDEQPIPDKPADFNFDSGESIGRLIAVTYGVGGVGNYYTYNKRGEVTQSTQVTAGAQGTTVKYSSKYEYNASGRLISESYPSGRIVKTNYDAAGRVFNITGKRPADTAARTYVSLLGYTAHGALAKMRLGNGLWEHTTYDPERLQPKEIGLGLSANESSALKLEYKYGDKAKNNDNIQSQTITVAQLRSPTTNAIISAKLLLTQTYTYDAINRLLTAEEKSGTLQNWKQTYTYKDPSEKGDQFGNRRIAADSTQNVNPVPEEQFNPIISITNNRIKDGQGYDYDDAGNLTQAPTSGGYLTYSYDAENRQIKLDGGRVTYTYDGEGRRVKKVVIGDTNTYTTIYVYNAVGQLVTEYAPYTNSSEEKIRFLTQDHLGSTRVVTDASTVVKIQADIIKVVRDRFDYLPFGEEIAGGIGNRQGVAGYNLIDGTRHKFTGQERDVESGLDYFKARYYAPTHGRFTSPDKPLMDQRKGQPQSWNLYTYVRNNPLRFIDPTGNISENNNPTKTQDQDDETEHQRRTTQQQARQVLTDADLEELGPPPPAQSVSPQDKVVYQAYGMYLGVEADEPTSSGATDYRVTYTSKYTAKIEDPDTGEVRRGYSYEIAYKQRYPIDPVDGRQQVADDGVIRIGTYEAASSLVFSGGDVRTPRFERVINKSYTGTITIYGSNGEVAITTSFKATVTTVQVNAGLHEPRIVETGRKPPKTRP